MKKTLLLLAVTGMWSFAGAQSNAAAQNGKPACKSFTIAQLLQQIKQRNDAKIPTFYQQATKKVSQQNSNARTAQTLSGIPVGSCQNVYGVLDASTTAATYNQATNLIVMTHRCDVTKSPFGTGSYEPSYSTDQGNVWDSSIVMFPFILCRYPNGVIFNPAGNTNPKNAYDVVAGPVTDNTNWVQTVYGSVRLDSTNFDTLTKSNGAPGVFTQNTGNLSYMTACDDSTVHVIGDGWTQNGTNFESFLGAVLTSGKFNGTGFTWSQKVIRPHFWDNFAGATAGSPYDSLAEIIGTPGTAWSQDGQTGYVVFFGNLDSAGYNFVSFQPVIYKTTDAGATWAMMPLQNFRKIPNLVKYLRPTMDSGFALPFWDVSGSTQGGENDYDLVVDKNNHLHIFGAVEAAYTANPDSAGYTYLAATYYIYDVFDTTPTGGWQARFIDSLAASPYDSVNNGVWTSDPSGVVSYGARIQASRTLDGSKIFCTWEDDRSTSNGKITFPDIYGEGYDVVAHDSTPVFQFTTSQDQYFMCASDHIMQIGSSPNTRYYIPCVYVGGTSNNDGIQPVGLYYQGSVVYSDSSFITGQKVTTVHEVKTGFSVSANYPNPFTKITQVAITLDKESTVGVNVYNMLGQKVWSVKPATMSSGIHVVDIRANSQMQAGIYFYRVTVNNQSVTHKMVIE